MRHVQLFVVVCAVSYRPQFLWTDLKLKYKNKNKIIYIGTQHQYLKSIYLDNNIIKNNILNKITGQNIFLSLKKLTCRSAKACRQNDIFCFENFLEFYSNI